MKSQKNSRNLGTIIIVAIIAAIIGAGAFWLFSPSHGPVEKIGEPSQEFGFERDSTRLQIGLITVGPIADWGYNYAQNQGRLYMEAQLGNDVKTTIVENVPESAAVERVMEKMIRAGAKVIFPTSYGYLDPALRVAKKHPGITFMHCGGFKNSKNLGTYFAYLDEPFYLSGIAAGNMTKSNKLGFVAAHPIPNVLREINAFTLGARSVKPEVIVHVVWTNNWSDPPKEAEAANSLIDQGCDVLAVHQDSPISVVQAAERKGVYSVGCHANCSQFAAKGWLTGAEWFWGDLMVDVIKSIKKGNWNNRHIRGGLKEGYVRLSSFGSVVPPKIREEINSFKNAILEGKLNVFKGPLKDRDGNLRLKEGEVAAFELLEKMNWFVEGVVGSLPK